MASVSQKIVRPFLLFSAEIFVLIAIVILAFLIWLQYQIWYDNTVPTAPVPEGARLIQRQPESSYHGAIARLWYYEKYSIDKPYEEVVAFYKDKGWHASPFGYFDVDVLPPVSVPVIEQYDKRLSTYLALPFKRDADDPLNETLIIVEVSKTPSDEDGFSMASFCSIPVLFVVGLTIVGYRFVRRIRSNRKALQTQSS